jgi:hypothetical protein
MNSCHDFYDNNSLDCSMLGAYIYYQAVGWTNRIPPKQARRTQDKEDITMQANGHTTVWGTHIGVGRAQDATGWYQQLREWWVARKVAREQARLAALSACWDARRAALKPPRADTAAEMVAAEQAFLTVITFS